MANQTDIVRKILYDIARALPPDGTYVTQTPFNISNPEHQNPTDWGPRVFPKLDLYDIDAADSQLIEEIWDTVSVIPGESTGDADQPINHSDFEIPVVQWVLGADTFGAADTQGSTDSGNTAYYPQITATVDPTTGICTIGGTMRAGDVIGVQLGAMGASVLVAAGDTPSTIAARLAAGAAAIGVGLVAVGPELTPGAGLDPLAYNLGVTVMAPAALWRHRQMFECIIRVDDEADRSIVGDLIETLYDPESPTACWLTIADGTQATVLNMETPKDTNEFAGEGETSLFIRRIRWMVDYVTVQSKQYVQVVAVNLGSTEGYTDLPDPGAPIPACLL